MTVVSIDCKTFNTEPAVEMNGTGVETRTSVLEWDGPNDPDNPINWPKWQRRWHIVPPAVISFTA